METEVLKTVTHTPKQKVGVEYVRLFLDRLHFLIGLGTPSFSLLVFLLDDGRYDVEDYVSNTFTRTTFKRWCINNVGRAYSDVTYSKALKGLVDHKILIKLGRQDYTLNPLFVWSRSLKQRDEAIENMKFRSTTYKRGLKKVNIGHAEENFNTDLNEQ